MKEWTSGGGVLPLHNKIIEGFGFRLKRGARTFDKNLTVMVMVMVMVFDKLGPSPSMRCANATHGTGTTSS